MKDTLTTMATSKKFLTMLIGLIITFGKDFIPQLADVDAAELAVKVSPVLVYILALGWGDANRAKGLLDLPAPTTGAEEFEFGMGPSMEEIKAGGSHSHHFDPEPLIYPDPDPDPDPTPHMDT